MEKEVKRLSQLSVPKHEEVHPSLRQRLSLGQRAADKLTQFCGSWKFIIALLFFMGIWIALNVLMIIFRWDVYPFILLNLILSCLAAIQAPIILMSQNRQTERDRITAQYDYKVNRKAEREIEEIQKDIKEIKLLIKKNI
jgi:uncharacterized membrane protein